MRIYNDKYLSVTSIIELREPFNKESFSKWCISHRLDENLVSSTSRILGEKVSEYLNDISSGLQGITAPQVDMLEGRLCSAMDGFLEEWELVSTEREVVCEELGYAGRYDGIIRRKGTHDILLVDWKTFGAWKKGLYKRDSKKIKHTTWQLTLYANALKWSNGLGVVIFKNNGTWELERVKFDDEIVGWVRDNIDLIFKVIEDEKKKITLEKV
jgi:hypothetical protein